MAMQKTKRTSNLFLVDGLPGSGKSTLLFHTEDAYPDSALMKKYTTRKKFGHEVSKSCIPELEFVPENEFEALKLEYRYEYRGYKYGFRCVDLDKVLAERKNTFIIVRDIPLIRNLLRDYRDHCVVTVFVSAEPELIRDRLVNQGMKMEELDLRLERLRIVFDDYRCNRELYQESLVNNGSIENYYRQIDLMMIKYTVLNPDE